MSVAPTQNYVSNSAVVRTNPAPQSQVVSGTDWLADVAVITDPVSGVWYDSYPINPCEPWTFPRLANIAKQYQKYEAKLISLVYTPSCATTQKGTIYLAPLRNPTDTVPDTPQLMAGLSGCVRSAVRDRCAVCFSRAQMSTALNGFYCGEAKGIAPGDDDVTKTCGRFVVMLDGVAKTDGVVGTLSLQYNFTVSDPKVVPEGAALHGSVTYDTLSTGDAEIGEDIAGSPAIIPYENGLFRKRTTAATLMLVKYDNAIGTSPSIVLCDDSVVAPTVVQVASTRHNELYRIPAGRHVVDISTNGDEWTNVDIESWSVSVQ